MKAQSYIKDGFLNIKVIGNKEYLLNFLNEMVENTDTQELIKQSYEK